jgi:DNA topoisomerase IB
MKKMYRISSDIKVYESENNKWKKSKEKFQNAIEIATYFKNHNNLNLIIDGKNPKFLKGQFCDGKAIGARINILPDGRKLNKAYSLFSPKLTMHYEKDNHHWDVVYQNPNGKFAYLYTTEKEEKSKRNKYKKVEEFSRCLPKLKNNLIKALNKDAIALPMIILLKTKIRIGGETYYLRNHHAGLTTLRKDDIKIEDNKITFSFLSKDGVPMKITEDFPNEIIEKMKSVLKNKKKDEFIFKNQNNHTFKSIDFENAFEKYCGKRFYPHIVRSHYATEEAKKFLEKNKIMQKNEVKKFYMKIAEKLGHKKFSKKINDWQNSYQVTLHYYINPKIVEKITNLII